MLQEPQSGVSDRHLRFTFAQSIDIVLFITDDPDKLPQATTGDYVHTLTKAGISGIPVFGSPAAELFAMVIAPPLTKRRDDWFQELASRLKELEGRVEGFRIENLSRNEAFVSAVFQATQIAVRTHQAEKREALRNALLHIALSRSLDEEMQIFFLGLIDVFTTTHIEVLRMFNADSASQAHSRSELSNRRTLSDPVVMDLDNRGLIKDTRPYVARGRESDQSLVSYSWPLSDLGRKFLSFISKPQ